MKQFTPAQLRAIHKAARLKLKAEVKATYHIHPVLWATIKGHSTQTEITKKLNCGRARIADALELGLIRKWGNRYLPTSPQHKDLRNRWALHLKRKAKGKAKYNATRSEE